MTDYSADAPDARRFAIPVIKYIRNAYGIGLKEAKDIHDGILAVATGVPTSDAYRTFLVVPKADHDRLKSQVDALMAQAAVKAERTSHECPQCGAYNTDPRLVFCSEHCYRLMGERVEAERRLAELDQDIAVLERDLDALKQERRDLANLLPTPDTDDAVNLDEDYPF